MRGRSKLSYNEAIRILARDDSRIADLDRVMGGALLAAAPFTGGASLALIDPKTEFIALLRRVTDTAPARIKASTGKRHSELLEATHTIIGLSSFFDALAETIGGRYAELEITDGEKRSLATIPAKVGANDLAGTLDTVHFPMPSVSLGFRENQSNIERSYEHLFDATLKFLDGLAAWEGIRSTREPVAFREGTIETAMSLYREKFIRLGVDVPEFAFWISLDEHAATRERLGILSQRTESAQHATTDTLLQLRTLLEQAFLVERQVPEIEAKLARRAASILDEALWRGQTPGLFFPTVSEGFISPVFRVALYEDGAAPADESWWSQQSQDDDLGTYLAHYIADPGSSRQPLLILGHPGAGKTLLTEVVAARIPENAFTTIVVRLRRVDADADLHQQIEGALESAVHEFVSWGDLCRESSTTKVIILDGFDELIQATGVTQSAYLEKIARFQLEEWKDGHAVVPIITSRTLVMDRVRIPVGTVMLKLDHFDDQQVERWTAVWNRANASNSRFRALESEELLHHGEIARQPLLLTLLAIYAAESGIESLRSGSLSGADLYRRLLDAFITRQVRDKAKVDLEDEQRRRLEDLLRWDLSVAAFAMFNRGHQFVSDDELGRDFAALVPTGQAATATDFGEPMSRANRTVAAFFFIHVAQADEHAEPRTKRTYEFLHATFGEYLVAERTIAVVRQLAQDRERLLNRIFAEPVESRMFRALISHQPLLKRQPVVDFAQKIFADLNDAERRSIYEAVVALLGEARDRGALDAMPLYEPSKFDTINRLAAYTSNLVTIAVSASTDGMAIADLPSPSDWPSTSRLWQAGLDAEGRESVFRALQRDGDSIVMEDGAPFMEPPLAADVAQLSGDLSEEAFVRAGASIWLNSNPKAQPEMELHNSIVELLAIRWPVPALSRLTPWDERAYRGILDMAIQAEDGKIASVTGRILLNCLIDDGPYLDPELVLQLTKTALDGRGVNLVNYALPGLLVRCPWLLQDDTITAKLADICDNADPLGSLLILCILPSVGDELRPVLQGKISQRLRRMSSTSMMDTNVAPQMIAEFRSTDASASLRVGILEKLNNFPEAWPQVHPIDMLAFVRNGSFEQLPSFDLGSVLNSYLEAHGREGASGGVEELLAALERYSTEED